MSSLTSACLCWILLSVVVLASDEQKAESGQNVVLPCQAPKGKTIVILKWSRADLEEKYVLLFRDDQFDTDPSFKNRVDLRDRQMKDGDVSLILKDVTTADDGEYQCQVLVGDGSSWKRSVITLRVDPPGSGGGSVGLIVGLSVLAVLLVVAVVGFVIYRKCKQSQDSY
ncbi:ICOS ligand-like [Archocentrus centrarchus]|uniref:ICOS ligand-like n=1 Tax=Archocentrus centrarchus TaxID=63155 RepID=UPI0011E9E47D|nr:ICOS ligand-like [Archocentrus centrarchus]